MFESEVEVEVEVGWSSEEWWVSVASSGRAVSRTGTRRVLRR